MSENPKRAWLKIELDLEAFTYAITGSVANINISLALADHLKREIEAQAAATRAPRREGVKPYAWVPPFKVRPE